MIGVDVGDEGKKKNQNGRKKMMRLALHNIKSAALLDLAGALSLRCRLVRRKDASWSLNWPSGAILLASKAAHALFFDASVTTVCLFFFVIGRVLTRLD